MNSLPFHVDGPSITLGDLNVVYIDTSSVPAVQLDLGSALLEDLSGMLGSGWFRLSGLSEQVRSTALFVALTITPTTYFFTQYWVGQSPTDGLYPVTFDVKNTGDDFPLSDVRLSIWDSAELNQIVSNLMTNINGTAETGLPSGSYKVFAHGAKISFVNPTSFVVSTSGMTVDINGTIRTVEQPSVGMVTVVGDLIDLTGAPLVAAKVRIVPRPLPQTILGGFLLDAAESVHLTDDNGHFEAELPGGSRVAIIIPTSKYQVLVDLPLSGIVTLKELLAKNLSLIQN